MLKKEKVVQNASQEYYFQNKAFFQKYPSKKTEFFHPSRHKTKENNPTVFEKVASQSSYNQKPLLSVMNTLSKKY
jgi:hypothetical protein